MDSFIHPFVPLLRYQNLKATFFGDESEHDFVSLYRGESVAMVVIYERVSFDTNLLVFY